jgi:AcrR family transcriptional regulator
MLKAFAQMEVMVSPQQGPATRAALIAGAIQTLRETGFAGASARQIARRASCNQALIFYLFGSVPDLLIAALEEVSAQRMAAYQGLLEHTGSIAGLVSAARAVFTEDLAAGHVTVLVEMISGAQSVPGLGDRIRACLEPWREFAQTAMRDVLASSPVPVPAEQAAHAVVAGILGLELLAHLDGDQESALAVFDQARAAGELLDRASRLLSLLKRGGKK